MDLFHGRVSWCKMNCMYTYSVHTKLTYTAGDFPLLLSSTLLGGGTSDVDDLLLILLALLGTSKIFQSLLILSFIA